MLITAFVLSLQPAIDIARAAEPARSVPPDLRAGPGARAPGWEVASAPGAIVLPPCGNGIPLLLRCTPRVQVTMDPRDVDLLNRVAVAPRPRSRPYIQTFSWD
ncbi:hypothetical protein [Methylobacterium sp. JK268]